MIRPRPCRPILQALLLLGLLTGLAEVAPKPAAAEERFLTLASTAELESAGLFRDLGALFTEHTGIGLRVVAVGDGQALHLARAGDADVLLAHDRQAEEALVAGGDGVKRYDVMYNDYLIVGPPEDPAGIRGLRDAVEALRLIAAGGRAGGAPFLSRGDESGTQRKELALWAEAGVDPRAPENSGWYREAGSDMGATLNTANQLGAYSLADRASWIAYNAKSGLELLSEGGVASFNQYGITLVNPARHPAVKVVEGETFVVWMTSEPGQKAIADFRVDGKRVFFPNALLTE